MKKGVFLNPPRANCSISESGSMMYRALRSSSRFTLDYLEVPGASAIPVKHYDFYAFNYHHVRMDWLDKAAIARLRAPKVAFVLEVAPGDPFVMCPPGWFDAYCALDPTLEHARSNVYGFPRPLEPAPSGPPAADHGIPVIGTFGFATPGKGFELVAAAANREFDRAVIRINMPPGDFADPHGRKLQRRDYAEYLADLVRRVAKRSIKVEVTRDYLSKDQLIAWCAENTLNCFLYTRIQPGLAATTDQAISSGRPLAVSSNDTFRHIHRYVTPYPLRTLQESISHSSSEVARMQRDWAPENFAGKFEQVLEDLRVLEPTPRSSVGPSSAQRPKKQVLIVNHRATQCGIHEYGINIWSALNRSDQYRFELVECSGESELLRAIAATKPIAIIYNHYDLTMPWLSPGVTSRISLPQFGLLHEVTQHAADNVRRDFFDFYLAPDPTLEDRNPAVLRIPRLIPRYQNYMPMPEVPTIGSFGFGMSDKGFERLVDRVQREFDAAAVRILMPFNDVVDPGGAVYARATAERCRARVKKPAIRLEIFHNFLSRTEMLDFLAGNTINAFLYAEDKYRGISSTIEHALAVQRPIAITRSGMFRHVLGATPSICIDQSSLRDIIDRGIAPLVPFYDAWSEDRFVLEFDRTLGRALDECARAGGRVASVQGTEDREKAREFVRTPSWDYYLPSMGKVDRAAFDIRSGNGTEEAFVRLAKMHVKPGTAVLDAGAVFGATSIVLSGLVGDQGTLHAFEDDVCVANMLVDTLKANHRANVTVHRGKRVDEVSIESPVSFMRCDIAYLPASLAVAARHKMPLLLDTISETAIAEAADMLASVGYMQTRRISSTLYLFMSTDAVPVAMDKPLAGGYNRILDNRARAQYAETIKRMTGLVPDMMSRKISEANVQQAFVLDTVLEFARKMEHPRILCVGSYEDTAAATLEKLGYLITGIDPALNYDLRQFLSRPEGKPESFDIIFSTSVLEHVKDDGEFLSDIARLLSAGGVAILTADYNDGYKPGDRLPQEDYRFYTQRDFRERLLPILGGCELVGTAQWDCTEPDFTYAGCRYTFATLVFTKTNYAGLAERRANRRRFWRRQDDIPKLTVQEATSAKRPQAQVTAALAPPSLARRAAGRIARRFGPSVNRALGRIGLKVVRLREP